MPLVVAVPLPAGSGLRLTTVMGLASGSASLVSTLIVTGAPALVVAVSLTTTGGRLGRTVMVTVAGAERAPWLSRAW
ncbi:hypothetical protein FQZ97_880840 [compost metagenome]